MKRFFIILSLILFSIQCAHRKTVKTPEKTPEQMIQEREPEIPEVKLEPQVEKIPLEMKITLTARNITLGSLLNLISMETGYNTLYDPGIDTSKTISVDFHDVCLKDALDKITDQLGLVYKIHKNILEIKAYDTWTFELESVPTSSKPAISVGGNVIPEAEGLFGSYMIKTQASGGESDFYKELEENIKSLLTKGGQYSLNANTGILMVSDSAKALRRIKNFVEKIKNAKKRQVHVEVKIIEVTLDKSRQHGIDWSFIDHFTVNNEKYSLNLSQRLSLSQFVFDVSLTGTRFNALLNFLATQGKIHILSKPSLRLVNGETALLTVGRVLAYWELTAQAGGVEAGTPVVYPVKRSVLKGVLLGLTPVITGDSTITLEIIPIISDINKWEQYEWNNQQLIAPDVDIKEAQTTLRIKSGETVIIGGLITQKEIINERKIPLLGDIPVLGNLFKTTEKTLEKSELVILITPTLL